MSKLKPDEIEVCPYCRLDNWGNTYTDGFRFCMTCDKAVEPTRVTVEELEAEDRKEK